MHEICHSGQFGRLCAIGWPKSLPSGQEGYAEDMSQEPADEWPLFFDRLVHDLREPLRSVQSFAELLREIAGGRLGPEGDQAASEILAGAARMRVLIEGVSRYAWALEPEQPEEPGASLQLAFDMTVIALDPDIAACGAAVTGEKLPRVGMRLERLARLLGNLIDNSLLFRGEAAPIINVTVQPDPHDSSQWLIRVEDNGIGIGPDDREAVFKPFVRLNGRKFPGAGLGLSACRSLVESCGGRIWMDAAPGGGSACLFTLPTVD
jgi:signal transduction histidine kinase